MKATWDQMGMPISIEIVDDTPKKGIDAVSAYFERIDARFSTYRPESEVSRLNSGALSLDEISSELQEVLLLAEQTKQETRGYFDIVRPSGGIDPSGIVKGWALANAAVLLTSVGYQDFCIDVGGDIAVQGTNSMGEPWSVGIRNPFKHEEIIKMLYPGTRGVATSGSAARGNHIYNPHEVGKPITDIKSITVIGPTVLEADRFATAAFAMGKNGIAFIESLQGFEAYSIDANGIATMTSGFSALTTI